MVKPIAGTVCALVAGQSGRRRHQITELASEHPPSGNTDGQVIGGQVTAYIARVLERNRGWRVGPAGVGSSDRVHDAKGAETIEGYMVDVEHDQVAAWMPSQAGPNGRRLHQRDAETLQLGPDRKQGSLVGAVNHPQGVEFGFWSDLPPVATVQASWRDEPHASHGVATQRLDHRCPQARLLEMPC